VTSPDGERLNQISGEIVDAAIHVHSHLGPGRIDMLVEQAVVVELKAIAGVNAVHERPQRRWLKAPAR
jgi:hypothetical protein